MRRSPERGSRTVALAGLPGETRFPLFAHVRGEWLRDAICDLTNNGSIVEAQPFYGFRKPSAKISEPKGLA